MIILLDKLGVPGWLLKLIIAYLTERTMVLRFKGCTTSEKDMPGGTPAGTLLGMLLFILLVNDVGVPEVENKTDESKMNIARVKFVYDLSMLEKVSLKKSLCTNINRVGPLNFHERNGLILPSQNSILQKELNNVENYAENNNIKIN